MALSVAVLDLHHLIDLLHVIQFIEGGGFHHGLNILYRYALSNFIIIGFLLAIAIL